MLSLQMFGTKDGKYHMYLVPETFGTVAFWYHILLAHGIFGGIFGTIDFSHHKY